MSGGERSHFPLCMFTENARARSYAAVCNRAAKKKVNIETPDIIRTRNPSSAAQRISDSAVMFGYDIARPDEPAHGVPFVKVSAVEEMFGNGRLDVILPEGTSQTAVAERWPRRQRSVGTSQTAVAERSAESSGDAIAPSDWSGWNANGNGMESRQVEAPSRQVKPWQRRPEQPSWQLSLLLEEHPEQLPWQTGPDEHSWWTRPEENSWWTLAEEQHSWQHFQALTGHAWQTGFEDAQQQFSRLDEPVRNVGWQVYSTSSRTSAMVQDLETYTGDWIHKTKWTWSRCQ